MNLHKKPLLSVCIVTYNHEAFIRACLDNAINQQVNFDYEIVIGEDHSTDNTLEICREYADRYPDLIRLIPHRKNIGMIQNWMATIGACKGKYIAMCEGDDYWTNNSKLQQQVDFLEANKEFALCFHDATIINERDTISPFERYSDYDWNYIDLKKDEYDLSDLLHATLCPTASVVFRRQDNFTFPDWYVGLPFADMSLFILVTGKQKLKFFKETWSVYRRHSASASAVPMIGDVFTKGKISMYLHLYEGLPVNQKTAVPGLLKKYIAHLPGILAVDKTDRIKIKKIVPLYYWQQALSHTARKLGQLVRK